VKKKRTGGFIGGRGKVSPRQQKTRKGGTRWSFWQLGLKEMEREERKKSKEKE